MTRLAVAALLLLYAVGAMPILPKHGGHHPYSGIPEDQQANH